MKLSEKPVCPQTVTENLVREMLDILYIDSKMIVTLMQLTNETADQYAKEAIVNISSSMLDLMCDIHNELLKAYLRDDQVA